jgi:large subunit ribosomal protein L10
MEKREKEAEVLALTEELSGKAVVLLGDFTGMDVETATEIRKRFRQANVRYRVARNTLAKRAMDQAGFGGLTGFLTGPNAIVMAERDAAPAAKIMLEFERTKSTPKIRAGWVDAAVLTAMDIRRIAELPSRDVLLAQIAAGFQAPVSGFARTLHELLRRLVSTLDEVAKQRGGGVPAAPEVTE